MAMRNRVPSLLLACFGLSVALLNAQSIVANGPFENRIASLPSGTTIRAAEGKSSTLQKYAELPLSFERQGDSEFVARGQGYAMNIRGARATIALPVSGVSSTIGMEFTYGRQVAAIPEKELPGKVNYILGNDPRRWRLGLPRSEEHTSELQSRQYLVCRLLLEKHLQTGWGPRDAPPTLSPAVHASCVQHS